MDGKMRYCYFGLLLLAYSGSITAAEITVYRWVDKNNVVHFSQHQPAHGNYTEITMTEAYRPPREATIAKDETTRFLEQASTDGLSAASLEKCNEAKANVRTLSDFEKIQYTDSDGITKVLNAEEKRQQLEISKKQVEVYCNNK